MMQPCLIHLHAISLIWQEQSVIENAESQIAMGLVEVIPHRACSMQPDDRCAYRISAFWMCLPHLHTHTHTHTLCTSHKISAFRALPLG